MYGKHGGDDYGAEDLLAHVYIENIPDREGQILRNELIDRFYRDGRPANPTYSLKVKSLNSRSIDLDVTQSADTTREQLQLKAGIELIDTVTGETVLKRTLSSYVSYNVLDSEFSTRISRLNSLDNALKDMARQIETDLTLYFNRSAKGL